MAERKTQITREEYYQLCGLFSLANQHNRAIEVIERAAAALVGEPPDEHFSGYYGLVSHHLIGFKDGSTADALLRALKIEVETADGA